MVSGVQRHILNRAPREPDLSDDDIEFSVRDVWHYKSAGNGKMSSFSLTRWWRSAPVSLANLVLLTTKEVHTIDVSSCGLRIDSPLRQFIEYVCMVTLA